ncbi:hypothetical protein [Shewanella gelidii]|uniref:PilZ domain-containing protein n=1 Tax=Shewanella gelidii TaxID=1642821 RepID=A0A917N9V2_9GAMM|nr:hypothetical protein [Shewanella gelidii]MCL1097543.1 hypothetical protein [Shewanella gelidii]GGI76142.1 hypothetical protein GCM10009332_11880 [Shewanella gelidii]
MHNDDNSYFSVPHRFNAYLSPFAEDAKIPSEDELKEMQSLGLKLISEVKTQEASCLLQLRQFDNEAKAVVDYLKLQSRKIDLVLQYVIESESQSGTRYQGTQFGGSGLRIESPAPIPVGHRFKLSLYMREELVAILCIVAVYDCQQTENGYAVDLNFLQILDADVELLVKASLNVQQKQLKARKQSRAE